MNELGSEGWKTAGINVLNEDMSWDYEVFLEREID